MPSFLTKLRVLFASSTLVGGPAPFVKDDLVAQGWRYKKVEIPPQACVSDCFPPIKFVEEPTSPAGLSAWHDAETAIQYRKACRAAAEKRYNPS